MKVTVTLKDEGGRKLREWDLPVIEKRGGVHLDSDAVRYTQFEVEKLIAAVRAEERTEHCRMGHHWHLNADDVARCDRLGAR